MKKLIHTLQQLNEEQYNAFEGMLVKNKSDKFLYLTKAYRDGKITDAELQIKLDCTGNALYVLKSRLYDKVQKFLTENVKTESASNDMQPETFDHYLYEYPRETAIAILQELETKCLLKDYSGDLINIYSALKKAHSFSDKYYTYSQLYNKQVAYTIALEKAEDVLFNFNRTLSNYYFSDSKNDKEMLGILKKEIRNIFALNKSHRIELILNTIIIQSNLFAKMEHEDEVAVEDLLDRNDRIIEVHGSDYRISIYKAVNAFLRFEYYHSINQLKKAAVCFDELIAKSKSWLLLNNNCLAFRFLLSSVDFALKQNKVDILKTASEELYYDRNDFYTSVTYTLNQGILHYLSGKVKDGIALLNTLLNEVSLVNFPIVEMEIKLGLAYMYCAQKEYELADNLLKSMSRKLSADKEKQYNNIKALIKIMNVKMNKSDSAAGNAKIADLKDQFDYYNTKERQIAAWLGTEISSLLKSK